MITCPHCAQPATDRHACPVDLAGPAAARRVPPPADCAQCGRDTGPHVWLDTFRRRVCGACAAAVPPPERDREVML